jgi:hypothetical protein
MPGSISDAKRGRCPRLRSAIVVMNRRLASQPGRLRASEGTNRRQQCLFTLRRGKRNELRCTISNVCG